MTFLPLVLHLGGAMPVAMPLELMPMLCPGPVVSQSKGEAWSRLWCAGIPPHGPGCWLSCSRGARCFCGAAINTSRTLFPSPRLLGWKLASVAS